MCLCLRGEGDSKCMYMYIGGIRHKNHKKFSYENCRNALVVAFLFICSEILFDGVNHSRRFRALQGILSKV